MSQQINFNVELLPAFETNYIFLFEVEGRLAVIDPGEAEVVLEKLEGRELQEIWITHHHGDHQGGVEKLLYYFPKSVIRGPEDDPRIPRTFAKNSQSEFAFAGLRVEVIAAPGHTRSHIIYAIPSIEIAFVGDVIFGLGCGRVFEGSYADMFATLQKLKKLSPRTDLYCAHEYTLANADFIQRELPSWNLTSYLSDARNARQKNNPTVPLKLSRELIFNPFLAAKDVSEFSYYRDLKNKF